MLVGLGRKHMNLHFSVTEPAPEYAFFYGNGQHSFGREERLFSSAPLTEICFPMRSTVNPAYLIVEHGGERPGYNKRHRGNADPAPGRASLPIETAIGTFDPGAGHRQMI